MWPAALSRDDAATYVSLSVSTIATLVAAGKFPPPRELSVGRVAWLRCELDQWLGERPVSSMLPARRKAAA